MQYKKDKEIEKEFKYGLFEIIGKLDNGSHSSNQLQGVDEEITKLFILFHHQEREVIREQIKNTMKTISSVHFSDVRDGKYYNGFESGKELALSEISKIFSFLDGLEGE